MPKERRDRSMSFDRCRRSPFSCSSSSSHRTLSKVPSETEENIKEWEDARCPVCMEHPHNAVLLVCSSHEKGCRPYMCDTSYRHSNCFDQFRKSVTDTLATTLEDPQQEEAQLVTSNLSPARITNSVSTATDLQEERTEEGHSTPSNASSENQMLSKLVCPLCRGEVKDWVVVEPARCFMNAKSRSCSSESCNFTGAYKDLRKHARLEHPSVRPSEADPERQRNWRRLERQRDLGDLLSTLQSSFGEERTDDNVLPSDDGSWLTVFFLIRVFRPGSSHRSSSWSGASRARAQLSIRRRSTRLWGESYDGESGSTRDEDNASSDGALFPWRRRVRRRTSPDDQQ
ncbi:SALT INDUCED ZINC FINGER PROTEIN1 [Hibiscus trionum]|uniref:SALT INDUCED ZINC FINGER PROTEIN1 n=1 Tax=Hibiscus trionum TaxID=183268 RepID=A0A9W7J3K4_HIBTR|nr:SALT INDUCED ZINC FINGER PROTEIN1 [Hibiscus trionum]